MPYDKKGNGNQYRKLPIGCVYKLHLIQEEMFEFDSHVYETVTRTKLGKLLKTCNPFRPLPWNPGFLCSFIFSSSSTFFFFFFWCSKPFHLLHVQLCIWFFAEPSKLFMISFLFKVKHNVLSQRHIQGKQVWKLLLWRPSVSLLLVKFSLQKSNRVSCYMFTEAFLIQKVQNAGLQFSHLLIFSRWVHSFFLNIFFLVVHLV